MIAIPFTVAPFVLPVFGLVDGTRLGSVTPLRVVGVHLYLFAFGMSLRLRFMLPMFGLVDGTCLRSTNPFRAVRVDFRFPDSSIGSEAPITLRSPMAPFSLFVSDLVDGARLRSVAPFWGLAWPDAVCAGAL